jgi:hypothetical protein
MALRHTPGKHITCRARGPPTFYSHDEIDAAQLAGRIKDSLRPVYEQMKKRMLTKCDNLAFVIPRNNATYLPICHALGEFPPPYRDTYAHLHHRSQPWFRDRGKLTLA